MVKETRETIDRVTSISIVMSINGLFSVGMMRMERMKMVNQTFWNTLESDRKIISVKKEKYMEKAAACDASIIFLLTGNIGVIKHYVDYFKTYGKYVFLHLEKIGGLSNDKDGLAYVANHIKPTGIITTKGNTISLAKKKNLITIQRLFVIDSDSVANGIETICKNRPDVVEIMPARIPELVESIQQNIPVPIIAGGLLENRRQMEEMLASGAKAISTGNPELWKENLRIEHKKRIVI